MDNLFIIDSTTAKYLKLVDEISHYDNMGSILANINKLKSQYPIVDISKINYKQYNWKDENIIAILNISGLIAEGNSTRDFLSGENIIGSDTVAKILSILRKTPEVKAVILRIDSGGGSALASDIISREIELFKKENEKKTIIISMGNIAASGAYWLSVFADKILANNTTITGSIGVFTGKISYGKLLEKIGITTDTFKINDSADVYSNVRELKDNERKVIRNSAEKLYRIFLERISKGRNIPIEKVEQIAQGRIYSGKKAKELNLVDEIGGISKAIDIARELSKINGKFKVYNINSDLEVIPSLINDPLQSFIPFRLFNMINNNTPLSIIPYWSLFY
jgi:protease-4